VSTQPLVLVADDEPRITKLVSIVLSEEGFRVVTASGGEEALRKAEEIRPDIVLLDIVMPDLDGIEVMRQLRERRPVAVILLTAKGSTADKAKGLDLGADDYIAKPFSPRELTLRVQAVLRRSSGALPAAPDQTRIVVGDLDIDVRGHDVSRAGERLSLTVREFDLLVHLASHPRRVFRREELLEEVWGFTYGDTATVTVHVRRLREKVEVDPAAPLHLTTVWGVGYRWDP